MKLVGIAIKEGTRKPMIELPRAEISTETGVEKDYRGKPGKRQVTVLSLSAWKQVCNQLKVDLEWTKRRANLLIDEIKLKNQTGARIRIGDAVLEITGETSPCDRMDEIYSGLKAALMPSWNGGVTCRVIRSGIVQVNDPVKFEPLKRQISTKNTK